MQDKPKTKLTPSKYQVAIFDYIEKEKGSLVINAVAGSGKSTTIIAAVQRVPEYLQVTFLAFNKSIVEELKKKLPRGINVSTFNAIGHQALMRHGLKFDMDKMKRLMATHKIILGGDFKESFALFNLSKGRGVIPTELGEMEGMVSGTDEEWISMYESNNATLSEDEEKRKRIIGKAKSLLKISLSDTKTFDFTDQLYLPLFLKVEMPKSDVIFVDEAQDLSLIQVELLKRMLTKTGRIIAVGDDQQAIYGFRGANTQSLKHIITTFNCKTLPLSVCYRCGEKIVKEAQEYSDLIEHHEGIHQGEVLNQDEIPMDEDHLNAGTAIISRINSNLMKYAISLLNHEIPFKYLGKDFREGLNQYYILIQYQMEDCKRNKEKVTLEEAIEIVSAEVLKACEEDEKVKVLDAFSTLLFVSKKFKPEDVDQLEAKVSDLMERIVKSKGGVTLTTIHQAKGLEFNDVYFVGKEKLPLQFIKNSSIIQQEENLIYVGITRAKNKLVYVPET